MLCWKQLLLLVWTVTRIPDRVLHVFNLPQDCLGNQERQRGSHFSHHFTIHSHMANKNVINTCKILEIGTQSTLKGVIMQPFVITVRGNEACACLLIGTMIKTA